MRKDEKIQLNFIITCISDFAQKYKISSSEAYLYMEKYKGLEFLEEFYDVEHTLSFEDAIDDVSTICRNNGGYLN